MSALCLPMAKRAGRLQCPAWGVTEGDQRRVCLAEGLSPELAWPPTMSASTPQQLCSGLCAQDTHMCTHARTHTHTHTPHLIPPWCNSYARPSSLISKGEHSVCPTAIPLVPSKALGLGTPACPQPARKSDSGLGGSFKNYLMTKIQSSSNSWPKGVSKHSHATECSVAPLLPPSSSEPCPWMLGVAGELPRRLPAGMGL